MKQVSLCSNHSGLCSSSTQFESELVFIQTEVLWSSSVTPTTTFKYAIVTSISVYFTRHDHCAMLHVLNNSCSEFSLFKIHVLHP